ncbi:MAG: glutamine amidotransferase [Phycisphaerae bacterium]|nr:glutamine amidotransferase [Phycisphaerae bacterium]
MDVPSHLVFEPPAGAMLVGVAVLGVLWEVVALARSVHRSMDWPRAVLVTAGAVVAGPALAIGVVMHAAITLSHRPVGAGKAVLAAALRGSVLLALGLILWRYTHSGEPGGVIVLGVLGAIWSLRSYGRTTSPLRPWKKAVLLSLRITAIFLLALWALGACVTWTEIRYTSPTLLIGVDTSASMQRRDAWLGLGGPPIDPDSLLPRIEAVRQALAKNDKRLEAIAERATIEWFTFDQAAVPRGKYRPADAARLGLGALQADGPATAIGDSAVAAVDGMTGKHLAAVLLISDGRQNTAARFDPLRFAELMASQKIHVFTACVGAERITQATHVLAVKELRGPDRVEVGHRLPASAAVEAMGLAGRRVRITAAFGETIVATRDVAIDEDEALIPFAASHTPEAPGYHRLTVSAELLGEPIKNFAGLHDASQLVHVTQNELRVLYVEGKFRFEYKFVTQALTTAQRFQVDARILLDPPTPARPNGLPTTLEGWLAYHVVIFGDVTPQHFSRSQLEFLRQAVGDFGRGFCMTGGAGSFGNGGWQHTPLADVLGVDLAASKGDWAGELRVVPRSNAAVAGELLAIGDDGEEIAAAWAKLPPLPGANTLAGVKPAAVVLADTRDHQPLIVWQQYGKGRSLAVGFDTTWNWVLNRDDTAEIQKRFWRQVALHLANVTGGLWIDTDATTYDLPTLTARRQAVTLRAGVEDSKGVPQPTTVDITVTDPTGAARTYTLPGGGPSPSNEARTLPIDPPTMPGIYVVSAQAQVEGKTLAAEHRFEVVHVDLESADVLANPTLLRRVARVARGAGPGDDIAEPHYRPLARLGELLDQLHIQAQPRPEPVRLTRNLSTQYSWPLLIAVLSLLALEWALRKRMGLV